MKTGDFDFYLPEHLIAQNPPKERGQSRLMTVDKLTRERCHRKVSDLPEILCGEKFLSSAGEKPLLVFNDTKVRKARLKGKSFNTGADAEFLLIDKTPDEQWKTLVKHAKRKKSGHRYVFFDNAGNEIAKARITKEEGEFRYLEFDNPVDDNFLDRYAHMPLPPYIKRADTMLDCDRYQTIFARETGSIAAPTAGLHFTKEMFDEFEKNGIEKAFVTLYVGLGTFLPVRSTEIEDHEMHEEKFHITDNNAHIIESAVLNKRKIIAVGTTSLRALESAFLRCSKTGKVSLKRGTQSTSIFIYPGFNFKITGALFTNFHTPLSSLLMLVSAFADRQLILESYEEAVKCGYRFFSYGDAMLII